jgi:hypothetical protein
LRLNKNGFLLGHVAFCLWYANASGRHLSICMARSSTWWCLEFLGRTAKLASTQWAFSQSAILPWKTKYCKDFRVNHVRTYWETEMTGLTD